MEIDYQDIGEALFHGLRVDYTYLHPEVLAERCTVEGKKLILNNQENREEYSVLIVPGGDTLSVAAAAKIKEFYDKGGVVISTSKLPTKSAEFGRDKEIQKMVGDVFGLPVNDPPTADLQRAMGRRHLLLLPSAMRRGTSVLPAQAGASGLAVGLGASAAGEGCEHPGAHPDC
jgi:hypothetical protein